MRRRRIGVISCPPEGLFSLKRDVAPGLADVVQFEFNEMNVVSRVFMKDFFDILPGYRLFRLLPQARLGVSNARPGIRLFKGASMESRRIGPPRRVKLCCMVFWRA